MNRTYEFGEFRLDASKRMLIRGGDEVQVSPKAIELLVLLVESGDRVVTRAEIMDRLWQDTFVEEGNINFHISNLRRALGQNGKPESQYIRTVPRKGYKFIADVRQSPDERPQSPDHRGVDQNWPRRYRPVLFAGAIAVALGVVFATVFGFGYRSERPERSNVAVEIPAEAVALYKKGKRVWESRVFTGQDPGELFRQAIAIAPDYLDAHIALADTHAFDATPEKAEHVIATARKIGGDSADLLATEAFIRMFHYWDWAGAEAGFQNAVAIEPENAKARHWHGVLLSLTGRLGEARVQMKKAKELAPDSLIIASDLGQLEYFAGDLSAAETELENVLRIEPRFTMARRYLADVHEARGEESEAFEERLKSVVRSSDSVVESQRVFEESGLRGIWTQLVGSGRCGADAPNPYDCARAFANLGDDVKALDQLEIAVHKRVFHIPFVSVDPVFRELRDSDRFRRVVDAIASGSAIARK